MTDRLAGKVAIVTGAGSSGAGVGNGKAASILFAREGASVLLVDRELERAQETLALIEAEGGTASAIAGDVTSAADCENIVRVAVERYGRLDILHNNVGISTRANVVGGNRGAVGSHHGGERQEHRADLEVRYP